MNNRPLRILPIISIQFTNYVLHFLRPHVIFTFLAVGPIFGLVSLKPLMKTSKR